MFPRASTARRRTIGSSVLRVSINGSMAKEPNFAKAVAACFRVYTFLSLSLMIAINSLTARLSLISANLRMLFRSEVWLTCSCAVAKLEYPRVAMKIKMAIRVLICIFCPFMINDLFYNIWLFKKCSLLTVKKWIVSPFSC